MPVGKVVQCLSIYQIVKLPAHLITCSRWRVPTSLRVKRRLGIMPLHQVIRRVERFLDVFQDCKTKHQYNYILGLFLKDIREKRIRSNTPAFPTDSQRRSEQKILGIVITCEQRTNFIIIYHIPFKDKNIRTNKGYDSNCIEVASSRATLCSLQQPAITKVVRSVYTRSNATENSGYSLRINR